MKRNYHPGQATMESSLYRSSGSLKAVYAWHLLAAMKPGGRTKAVYAWHLLARVLKAVYAWHLLARAYWLAG